jgi:hypothetical protein
MRLVLVFVISFGSCISAAAYQSKRVLTNRDLPTNVTPAAGNKQTRTLPQTICTKPSPRESWRPLGKGFFADGDKVRLGSTLQLKRRVGFARPENFQINSFAPLGCGFVRDSTGVYMFNPDNDSETEVNELREESYRVDVWGRVDIVDSSSFQVAKQSVAGCEARDKDFLYRTRGYSGGGGVGVIVEGNSGPAIEIVRPIGAGIYERLECGFVKTHGGIFWAERRVDADEATFRVLHKEAGRGCGYGFYAKDKARVFYRERIIKGADPLTFTVLDTVWSYSYAFDQKSRYSQGRNIMSFHDPTYEMKRFEEAYSKWKQNKQGKQ